ncbi:hypothetical protein BGZ95_009787 [Linnemannia exigua]|uniref:Uncharacterized protein n=1 Tax=Linnemannia exigua TaxID=604196 RepID=A0AAD4DCL8_9FUNG|nr:hypothetical protein BGZ95_009787 [Linnemannia exigua]
MCRKSPNLPLDSIYLFPSDFDSETYLNMFFDGTNEAFTYLDDPNFLTRNFHCRIKTNPYIPIEEENRDGAPELCDLPCRDMGLEDN